MDTPTPTHSHTRPHTPTRAFMPWLQKNRGFKKIVASKKSWPQKNRGFKKIVASKKSWLQKNRGFKKIVASKKSWLQKNRGFKKIVASKKSWLQIFLFCFQLLDQSIDIEQSVCCIAEVLPVLSIGESGQLCI
jgi:uncharacterized protein YktA (UPF0223 family)